MKTLTSSLVLPRDFYQQYPNIDFPEDRDQATDLKHYMLEQQFKSPPRDLKSSFEVKFDPQIDLSKDITECQHNSYSRGYYYRTPPSTQVLLNCKFFTVLQLDRISGNKSRLTSLTGVEYIMYTSYLQPCIKAGAFFPNGYLIGHFIFCRKSTVVGIRPFNPNKDKLL